MPYIPEKNRINLLTARPADTAGELNYIFTAAIVKYLARHGTSYRTINDAIGALEGAKAEFYRRVAAPYEEGKIKENGDVYGPDPEDL